MTDIFISYSRKDVAVASELARTLEELGYSVWWDIDGLHGGQSFANVIQEKLSEAKCAIVLWSPDSVTSKWVQSEASFADDRGILVTAVCREALAPMPFNNRHNESLRVWNGSIFDDGFQKLLKAVSLHCPEPSGKPRSSEEASDVPVITERFKEEVTATAEPMPKVETKAIKLDGPKLPSMNKQILVVTMVALGSVGYYFWSGVQEPAVSVPNILKESQEDKQLPVKVTDKAIVLASKEASNELDAVQSVHVKEKSTSNKIYNLPNNLTLLPMPAGSFMMGSNNGSDDEKPVHKVIFAKPFWMSKTEVTFDQYDRYARLAKESLPDDEGWGRGTRPVINVSWDDAQGYVKWLSGTNNQGLHCRLPSEAEWEYVARAGTTTKYSWGDKASHEYANYGNDKSPYGGFAEGRDKWVNTAPVASFPPNQWAVHDMHGNVWEWVQDRYHQDYKGAPVDGSAWEVNSDARVIRGGSWFSTSFLVRSAYRLFNLDGFNDIGFRVVCSPI